MPDNSSEIQKLIDDLKKAFPGGEWLPILATLEIVGVADAKQLQHGAGLERTKLQKTIEKLSVLNGGLPPIVQLFDHTLSRSSQRGRLPNIYLLGETGAALLRASGYPDAHACRLHEDRELTHAMVMLDVHMAARSLNLEILTDHIVPYGEGQFIRPDHQVLLPGGKKLIVEVEQEAKQETVRRVSESLKNKMAFFASSASQDYFPIVLMVVNPNSNIRVTKIHELWRNVIRTLVQDAGQHLGFQLFSISLTEFMRQPEFSAEVSPRWRDLTSENAEPDTYSQPSPKGQKAVRGKTRKPIPLPLDSKQDLVLLQALQQEYRADPAKEHYPDTSFLEVMVFIYSASHPEKFDIIQTLPPYESVYLLKSYLELHPDLQDKVRAAMHYGHSRIHWNQTTILHRMQRVIDTFLAHFQWGDSSALSARSSLEGEMTKGPFKVHVSSIGHALGDWNTSRARTQALAWVLWALFEYADQIGLGRPQYW